MKMLNDFAVWVHCLPLHPHGMVLIQLVVDDSQLTDDMSRNGCRLCQFSWVHLLN